MLGYGRYRHSICYISLNRHVIGINQTTKYMTQIREICNQMCFIFCGSKSLWAKMNVFEMLIGC